MSFVIKRCEVYKRPPGQGFRSDLNPIERTCGILLEFEVGHYLPNGNWYSEKRFDNHKEARAEVHYLNGGCQTSCSNGEIQALKDQVLALGKELKLVNNLLSSLNDKVGEVITPF